MAQMEKINLRAFPQRRTAATYIFRFELEVSFSPFFTIQCWLSNVKHLKKARSPNIATSSSMLASANAFAVPANTTSLHSVASSRVVTVFGYYLVAKNSIKSEIIGRHTLCCLRRAPLKNFDRERIEYYQIFFRQLPGALITSRTFFTSANIGQHWGISMVTISVIIKPCKSNVSSKGT